MTGIGITKGTKETRTTTTNSSANIFPKSRKLSSPARQAEDQSKNKNSKAKSTKNFQAACSAADSELGD